MVDIRVLRIAMAIIVVSLVTSAIARVGFTSSAAGQALVLTEAQSGAMHSYNAAVSRFKSVLQQRRTQIAGAVHCRSIHQLAAGIDFGAGEAIHRAIGGDGVEILERKP